MKKLLLSLAFVALLISCQEKTKEKFEEARDAVAKDITTTLDSAKIKAAARMDTLKAKAKIKIDSAKIKSADRLEKAAEKIKESVKK